MNLIRSTQGVLAATLALSALATTTCTEKQALMRPSAITPLEAVASVGPGDGSGSGVTTMAWRCFAAGADGPLAPSADPACAIQHPSSLNRLAVGTAAAVSPPGAPTNFSYAVIGNDVSLGWTAPVGGAAPTSYWIEAGSTPGGTDLIAGGGLDTGNLDRAFVALGVPTGSYYVRVKAKNAAGLSAPSTLPANEVPMRVGTSGPCAAAPGPPSSFSSFPSGSSVNLTWAAPVGGCAPTEYVLEYGTTAGTFPNRFATGNKNTSYMANGVPDSTFYVRGMARNGYGTSAVSNTTTFVIGNGGAPPPPTPATPCTDCELIFKRDVAGCDNQWPQTNIDGLIGWNKCWNIAWAKQTDCWLTCKK
jgi:hypothetical protein